MQKLSRRKTYTPTNTSLVRGDCDLQLNKDENLSVADFKTFDNNLEVNPRQHTDGLKDKVYVLSMGNQPLMPCSVTKARHLLEARKAKIVRHQPFCIQLLFECENKVQELVLGVDPGYEYVGFSVITKNEELISGELVLENGMSKRLLEKVMYRKGRRNKLWYRQPRFLNRKKKFGLNPPSVERRIETHITLVKKICELVPVSKVNFEVANFDIQRINNPNVEGEGYQQGSLYGYENTKAFVLNREHGKCQLCGNGYDETGWHLHHIIPKSKGGTDKPNNQALLHKKCHEKLHKQKLFKKLNAEKQFKAEIFMLIAKEKIMQGIKKMIPNVGITFGYETKIKRNELKIEKTHNNDAFVIAGGTNQERSMVLHANQKKHNNRCLQLNRKGYKPSIRKIKSTIQPRDLFWVDGIKYICKGMFGYGKYILYGNVKKKEYFKIEQVSTHFNTNTWQFIRYVNEAVFLPQKG